jgi:predicted ATPase
VTFLFTDVEGSTRRWEADAQTMRVALALHDEVLRRVIDERGGYLFKHTGDGVCAAFASPKSAVEAAIAAQRELELPVRMGIATGEAELRDSDYFGTVLNRAARVMAAGHGGQILVADSTVRLLSGVELVDLGQHRLRDLPDPIGVFQVRALGMRSEFPPLRTLTRRVGNIRPPSSSFVGRDADAADLIAELHRHRMVTLTGVGGVGKTRLAVEAALRAADEFSDGVWLLELAAVSDPAAVPDAVAAVFGVTQQAGMTMVDSVAEAIAGRHQLLVVDNCEHLRDAAADLIDAILARSADARILATSREALGIGDEHLWPVESLDVRDGVDSSAAELFVDRARSVAAGFELSESEEQVAAVEICRRLDGIPLAIELAASRMASMTVSEVRDRLGQRFRLLVGSRRGLERHQTLRHTVAWSFDLLRPPEKELLQRCSVFSGGFDLAGTVAVAASETADEFEVLDLLDALVRKSLLVAQRSSGRTRYSMLETIRQFAEEQLVADGTAADVRTVHAAYFAGREDDLEALWNSPRQREVYDWLSTELPNLRTAFRWAADENQIDAAAVIATYAGFLGYATEVLEPLAWAEELIPLAAGKAHPRLAALQVLAGQCWMQWRTDDAVRFSDAALITLRSMAKPHLPFGMHGLPGAAYMASGEPHRAEQWYRLCTESRSREILLDKVALVLALVTTGDLDLARDLGAAVVDEVESVENAYMNSFAMLAYGYALFDVDPVSAFDTFRRGADIAERSGNRAIHTHLTASMARVAAHHGEPIDALNQLTTVIQHYISAGNVSNLRNILVILVVILVRHGRLDAAAMIGGFTVTPFTTVSFPEIEPTMAQLRAVLGEERSIALTRKGTAMAPVAMAEYAQNEIDDLRAELAST